MAYDPYGNIKLNLKKDVQLLMEERHIPGSYH